MLSSNAYLQFIHYNCRIQFKVNSAKEHVAQTDFSSMVLSGLGLAASGTIKKNKASQQLQHAIAHMRLLFSVSWLIFCSG